MMPRRHDLVRQYRPLHGDQRRRVVGECDALLAEIDRVDEELAALAARRHRLVVELKQRRRRLTPMLRKANRGRQPMPGGTVRLPPLSERPTPLWGRRLRSVCLALLRRAGPLILPEIHALLHHHGYRIDSSNPVKTLSDALAYEVEQGRAVRLERGVYGPGSGVHDRGSSSPGTRFEHLPEAIAPRAA